MDIVQDTLLMLVGDPSPRQMAKRVIREVIPPSVQEIYLEEIKIESSADLRYPAPMEVQYEGNRRRCFDSDPSILAAQQSKMASQQMSRDSNRFIRRVIEDMERCGIISLAPEYEEWQTRPVVIQGSDGALDIYFPYGHGDQTVEGERVPSLPLPTTKCLLDFAQSYKQKYANAIMAKGSIQTHYCAWPMPAIKSLGRSGLNFATWEGHIYRWNAMRKFRQIYSTSDLSSRHPVADTHPAFDRPFSANAWQYYIQHFLNTKYPFVMFYLTTFVICATDKEDADRKAAILLDEMEDRGWKVSLPPTYAWTPDIDRLKLETLFSGIRPA